MAGLLDILGSDTGLLGLQLMAAGSAKPVRTGFGEGLLSSLQAVQAQRAAEEDRKARQQMQAMQLQQMQEAASARKQAQEQQQQRMSYLGAIDSDQGPAMPLSVPRALSAGLSLPEIGALSPQKIDPMAGFDKVSPKDYTPESLAAFMQTRNPAVLRAAPKDQAPDEFERALRLAGIDPASPQGRQMATARAQKMATHQPATSVNVNTEKPLLNSVASKLGEQIDTSLSNARAASQAIDTAQSMKQALDTGKVISGPGATFRVIGLQLGQMLGVNGKDATEVLSNTRTVIQSMAKGELEAAQQMKGQGQITEAERDIIRRAASGNIDKLTGPEIRLLADSMEKTARSRIAAHRANVKALGQMPNAAPLMPFYQVDEPAPYEPQGVGTGKPRRYNPATGRIE